MDVLFYNSYDLLHVALEVKAFYFAKFAFQEMFCFVCRSSQQFFRDPFQMII